MLLDCHMHNTTACSWRKWIVESLRYCWFFLENLSLYMLLAGGVFESMMTKRKNNIKSSRNIYSCLSAISWEKKCLYCYDLNNCVLISVAVVLLLDHKRVSSLPLVCIFVNEILSSFWWYEQFKLEWAFTIDSQI